MDAEECLLVLKEVLINKIIPESIEFNLSEVLQLTCWGDAGTHENNIGIAFSLVFLLTGDYQAQITEDANEYWLMHLFVMCSSFDQEYKEALLEFYLWYIQYEATYETPSILVYYLIIATMVALEVPVETVKPMLAFLRQTNYDNTSLTHSFFPKDKIPAVKKMLEETIAQYKSDADFADDFLGVYEEMLAVKLKDDE